jgi:hypothetical protein
MTYSLPNARTSHGATARPCPRGGDTTTHAHGDGAAGMDKATSLDALPMLAHRLAETRALAATV